MSGIGIPEMILISIVALLFFGPSRLPALGQAIGKTINNFKKGLSDSSDKKLIDKKNIKLNSEHFTTVEEIK